MITLIAIAIAAGAPGAPRADEPTTTPFDAATTAIEEVPGVIEARLKETEALRTRAAKSGQALKASCIDQKVRQIRQALAAARQVGGGWALAQSNEQYRERTLYRMRVLKLYAIASADAAYTCVDVPAGTTTITVDSTLPSLPLPPSLDTVRPPTVDRPPLASPY